MPSTRLALNAVVTVQALGFAGLMHSITHSACTIKEETAATEKNAVVDFKKACEELLQGTIVDLLQESTADFRYGWLRGKIGPVKFANSQGKDRE
ncbi:hypothetical protein WJX74_006894 [Apatococcus lobatus]|uniref:Uncharacterized protein n=1 Tax=Apatococcus lobatus TaxID=904363 RepID=A0AAW1QHX7_9CHLO